MRIELPYHLSSSLQASQCGAVWEEDPHYNPWGRVLDLATLEDIPTMISQLVVQVTVDQGGFPPCSSRSMFDSGFYTINTGWFNIYIYICVRKELEGTTKTE